MLISTKYFEIRDKIQFLYFHETIAVVSLFYFLINISVCISVIRSSSAASIMIMVKGPSARLTQVSMADRYCY